MTLSLANSVEDVEPGCSGCNTQSDSESEPSNSFRFTDFKDAKLMTRSPAKTIVFTDSPHATIGDTFHIRIGTANIDGKELKNITSFNNQIPCENNDDIETNQVEAENPVDPTVQYKRSHTRFFSRRKLLLLWMGTMAVGVVYLIMSNQLKPVEHGNYISRENWGAMPSKAALIRRTQPATLVIITNARGDSCLTYDKCKSRVQSIQKYHINIFKLTDIAYNFLIGGDGRIYEGMGWDWENIIRNDSISIAFIGNFTDVAPSDEMLTSAVRLIDLGWDGNWIDKNTYHVVSHNQTEPKDSPGEKLFAMLPKWFNHYSENALCFSGCNKNICDFHIRCP